MNETMIDRLNAPEQVDRLNAISGEDINSPFQGFICEKIETPEFKHLIDSAWALIGHEFISAKDLTKGMFSAKTLEDIPDLDDRVRYFSDFARWMWSANI